MTLVIDVQALAAALGFSLEQLEANRSGRITRDQLMALAPEIGMALVLLVAVIGVLVLSRRLGGPWTLQRGLVVAAVAVGGLAFGAWIGLAPVRDVLAGAPAVVQGPLVEVRSVPRAKQQAPLVVIGDVELYASGVPDLVREQLVPGTYRAYYLPHTRRLLSLEPVP